MDIKQILPIVFILVVGCSSPTSTDHIVTIDIEKAFNRTDVILLSEFSTNEIEYIPLETHTDALIAGAMLTYATEKYLIVSSRRYTRLFDRKTGKFINEIAYAGPGANEHISFPGYNHPFDENSQTVRYPHLQGGIEYNLKGNVTRKISFPKEVTWGRFIPLDANSYAMYKINITGNEPYKLYVFDNEGNELNKFPNHHSYDANLGIDYQLYACTYKWKNDVFFYENCVDTLYKITGNDLIPYFHFQLGKYNPPYSEKPLLHRLSERPLRMNYFMFNTINESDRFLFFSFEYDKKDRIWQRGQAMPVSKYFGFYDKQTGVTKISEVDHTDNSPVINDIDDFAPIYPCFVNINQSGEMVTYMEAEAILEWFEKNPEKAGKLPERLQMLSKLKFDDNPIVVIAKLKQ